MSKLRFVLLLSVCVVAVVTAATLPTGAFALPDGQTAWFSGAADLDGDGNDDLIMGTLDSRGSATLSDPTPIHVLRADNGALVDRSDALFGAAPAAWSTRTVVTGDFNGDGRRDLFICAEGRKPADPAAKTNPRTPGSWGEQSQVWFAEGDHFVDRTALLPQSIAFCHGASAGDVDKAGRASIVMNTVGGVVNDAGGYPPYPPTYFVKWNGSGFSWTAFPTESGSRAGKPWGFYTGVGDFNGDGFADVAGEAAVLLGGATVTSKALTPSAIETDYGSYNGTIVGDVNGDGRDDVVKVQSLKSNQAGARFSLYLGDAKGGLVEKTDAFPALESYNVTEFGLTISLVDINFDGALDIETFGRTNAGSASLFPAGTEMKARPTAVWINDGSGRFTLQQFNDRLLTAGCNGTNPSAVQIAYFLKTADPNAFNLVVGGCAAGSSSSVFTTRTVTPSSPLTLTRP